MIARALRSFGLALLVSGCVSTVPIQQVHGELLDSLASAADPDLEPWAQECAPNELALARAHRDFAELEFEQGDLRRGNEHLLLARDNARAAVDLALACRPKDGDKDGVTDDVDECPEEPEDLDSFKDSDGCPELDNDGDGRLDVSDQCPNDPEDSDGFEDMDGCPDMDNDEDGLADIEDQCPDDAEDMDGHLDDDGCPDLDKDMDGVADADDRCPDEKENMNEYLDHDGCPDEKPQFVRISRQQIHIDQKIQFQTGKSKIKSASYDLLDSVVKVLEDYPHIRVRIEGHTDSDGSESFNQRLSQRRAESVFQYLSSEGVDRGRLEAVGIGEARPIDTNRTDQGKANNRRVEFHIVEGM